MNVPDPESGHQTAPVDVEHVGLGWPQPADVSRETSHDQVPGISTGLGWPAAGNTP